MYNFIVDLVGTLPTEFEFIYAILTLLLAFLVISFLFYLFYIPIQLLRRWYYVRVSKFSFTDDY